MKEAESYQEEVDQLIAQKLEKENEEIMKEAEEEEQERELER